MSFRDSDGRITIDEVASEKDIKQLQQSKEKMQMALKELQEIVIESDEFSGNTGIQIKEITEKMIVEIKKAIQDTDDTITNIQKAVNKYQQIDINVKAMINSGRN